MSLSACRGSASYSILSSNQVITRFSTRACLASSGAGPSRGPTEISYSAATACSYQSRLSAGPHAVKSSPCTETAVCRCSWRNTFALLRPCEKPRRTSSVLYSSCQPSAAERVPYIWRSSSPQRVARSGSSGGSSTKHGAESLSTLALKYARLTSRKLSCIRRWDFGFQSGWCLPLRVIAKLITMRTASNGGAGAKYEVPDKSNAFICLAT